jgi:hypothetical protein
MSKCGSMLAVENTKKKFVFFFWASSIVLTSKEYGVSEVIFASIFR